MQKQRVVFGDIVRKYSLIHNNNPGGDVFTIHVVNLRVSRLSGDEDEVGNVIVFQTKNREDRDMKAFCMNICNPVEAFYFSGTSVFRLNKRILQKGMNIE